MVYSLNGNICHSVVFTLHMRVLILYGEGAEKFPHLEVFVLGIIVPRVVVRGVVDPLVCFSQGHLSLVFS